MLPSTFAHCFIQVIDSWQAYLLVLCWTGVEFEDMFGHSSSTHPRFPWVSPLSPFWYCHVVEDNENVLVITDSIIFKAESTSGNQHKKSLPGLQPDTKYRFALYAENEAGAGAISDEVTAQTYPSSQVPGKPQKLVAEAESDSSIRVTWSEPDTG